MVLFFSARGFLALASVSGGELAELVCKKCEAGLVCNLARATVSEEGGAGAMSRSAQRTEENTRPDREPASFSSFKRAAAEKQH